MITRPFPILLFLLSLLAACSSDSENKSNGSKPNDITFPEPADKKDFPKAVVVEAEKVDADTNETYALYLPEYYDHRKAWPITYFFDSHADGESPVRDYAILAETYGWVLAGSNVSQNGMDQKAYLGIADRMIKDLEKKLNIDGKRIYMSGFSGGARVAAMLAQNRRDIHGVIACGAGFQPRQGDTFAYVGLVGTWDFNYQEISQLGEALKRTKHPHMIEFFRGGHNWPPFSQMEAAMVFLQMREFADGTVAKNDSLIDGLVADLSEENENLKAEGKNYERWRQLKKSVAMLQGLRDVEGYRVEITELEKGEAFSKEQEKMKAEMKKELILRDQYSKAVVSQDLNYWKKTTESLNNGKKEEYEMNRRLLNFLSLTAFMQAGGALQQGALPDAERLIGIYALVDPRNSEHRYMLAQLRMKQSRQADAVAALRAALDLGMDDVPRVEADPLFAPLKGDPAFTELLEDMRTRYH